ncbi:MAG: hypothetical protein M1820_006621 [Bogoriella megaspora]|nr:MAG: hypothetical protein M1820_006621 [Bogoriella megaspora]
MFRALAEEVPLNPSLSQRFSTRRLSAGSVDSATGVYITNFIRAPNRDRLYYAWQTIIADYSERALTILSDKLPAISGLAKVLLRACNSDTERYLAGLWYENLPWGLLWYVCGPPIHFRPSSPAIAPSWSWASLVGRIEYFCNSYQFGFASNVKILEAGCLLRSTDPTGAVRGGFIRLEGCLIPVSLRIETTDSPTQSEYTGKAGCASRASPNTTVSVSSVSSQRSRWYEILYDEIRWDSTAHTPQLETQSVRDREFFCLEIGASFDRKLYGHTARFRTLGYGSRMWWLVLEATTQNDGSRAYRRVGLGYWHMKMSTSDTGLYYLFDGAYPQEVTLI